MGVNEKVNGMGVNKKGNGGKECEKNQFFYGYTALTLLSFLSVHVSGAEYSPVRKHKRRKKTRKMSPPHTPPPLPPPLRAKMVEECKIGENKEECQVDADFVKFKVDCRRKKTGTSMEVNVEAVPKTETTSMASALSEAATIAEEEPSNLGLTCIRCRRPLASNQEGKNHKHPLKPSFEFQLLDPALKLDSMQQLYGLTTHNTQHTYNTRT